MSAPVSFKPSSVCRAGGFSLVEVVLAIGIVSFALLVVLGTIPAGLSTMADAGQGNTKAEIIRTVVSELKSTPYDRLEDFLASGRFPIHLDIEGKEVPAASSVFTVRAVALPATSEPAMRVVKIFIGMNADPDTSANSPQRGVEIYPVTLADWGQ